MALSRFKPGVSGNPSGRPKGIISSRKQLAYDALERHGFDPFDKLIEIAKTAQSEQVRFWATAELCSYVAPKLKSIELKNDSESPVVFAINIGEGANGQLLDTQEKIINSD